ncbi:hypothetical protein IAR55_002492 [Kwoniella newhampshirensis]|uniref:Uncharacterized protein n=1 Tax=Kwoniella newhampshirensis TaxID=1651941 RepID=A0AAW0Z1M7_9TREE
MSQEDPWRDDFRSPSPTFSDLACDDTAAVGPPTLTDAGHDLRRELDLSLRADYAEFKQTPWTLAGQRRGRTGQEPQKPVGNIKAAGDRNERISLQPTPAGQPRNQDNQLKASTTTKTNRGTTRGNPYPRVSEPKPAGRHKVPPGPSIVEPRVRYSQWRDADGSRIPVDPRPPRSLMTDMDRLRDEQEKKEKRNEARRIANTRKKARKDKENEQIEFRMIPKGAGPTSGFPIVQALEKQKSLPAKKKRGAPTKKRNIKPASPSPPPKRKVADEDVDEMVTGIVNQKPKFIPSQDHMTADSTQIPDEQETESTRTFRKLRAAASLVQPPHERLKHPQPKHFSLFSAADQLDKYKCRWDAAKEKFEDCSKSDPSQKRGILATPPEDIECDDKQPSTITHLASSVVRDLEEDVVSSSSAFPYSSPLADKGRLTSGPFTKSRSSGPPLYPDPNRNEQSDASLEAHATTNPRAVRQDMGIEDPYNRLTTGEYRSQQPSSPLSQKSGVSQQPDPYKLDHIRRAGHLATDLALSSANNNRKERIRPGQTIKDVPRSENTQALSKFHLLELSSTNTQVDKTRRDRTPPGSLKYFCPVPDTGSTESSRRKFTVVTVNGDKYGPQVNARAEPYDRSASLLGVNRSVRFIGQRSDRTKNFQFVPAVPQQVYNASQDDSDPQDDRMNAWKRARPWTGRFRLRASCVDFS